MNNVKENVVGQGTLQELGIGRTISHHVMEDEFEDPPPPLPSSIPPIYSSVPQFEDRDSPPLPPPPMDLLDLETLTHSLQDIEHGRQSTVQDDPKYGFTKENGNFSSYPSSINGNSQHPKPGSSLPRNTYSSSPGGQKYCKGLDAETPLSSGLSKLVRSGWTCSGCGDTMFPGDVAIFAERQVLAPILLLLHPVWGDAGGPAVLLQQGPAVLWQGLCTADGHSALLCL